MASLEQVLHQIVRTYAHRYPDCTFEVFGNSIFCRGSKWKPGMDRRKWWGSEVVDPQALTASMKYGEEHAAIDFVLDAMHMAYLKVGLGAPVVPFRLSKRRSGGKYLRQTA
jgi:hypothetical protein